MNIASHDEIETRSAELHNAIRATSRLLRETGTHLIEVVTITRARLGLQPRHLRDGQSIAQELGLDLPLDHQMFVPGHTVWTGDRYGLEVQVRAELRRPDGAAR
ncbi:hypothetical protein [Myceligenerans pegani]|uniref:Uncharacterized protein n=1 Tax=Myceligenerans pegani TaxID=2776917 RepID=A0ABR9N6F4_9MICO|nr:hypothetical protein [Myceligenerans sp. TRM 65318]MBE1878708.1 hypothetical protein [Myceligenerans sp. TRM 65318]MBE3020979.1 hypothetical protein [Myceligenerans sp. TRM 65318]